MRNIPFLAPVSLLLALAPAARADTRIAIVDFQRAGWECDEGKAAAEALQKEGDEKIKPFTAKKAEFDTLRSEYEKQQAVLSPEARQAKESDLQKRDMELQQMYMQIQRDMAARNEEVSKGVSDRLNALVRDIAEKEGIQVVLNKTSVVYAPDALDLTNEIIRKYNARFPAKAGAAGGAAKPAGAAAAGADPKAKPAPKAPKTPGTK